MRNVYEIITYLKRIFLCFFKFINYCNNVTDISVKGVTHYVLTKYNLSCYGKLVDNNNIILERFGRKIIQNECDVKKCVLFYNICS